MPFAERPAVPRLETAQQLLEHARQNIPDWCNTVPVPIERCLEVIGVGLIRDPGFRNDTVLGELRIGNGVACFALNTNLHAYYPRERATLAHLIGRLCTRDQEDVVGFSVFRKDADFVRSYWGSSPSPANQFATELLMPANDMRASLATLRAEASWDMPDKTPSRTDLIDLLARQFEVPNRVMESRLCQSDIQPELARLAQARSKKDLAPIDRQGEGLLGP